MIVLQGFIVVPDSDLEIVQNELDIHSKLTRDEKGCVTFSVTQDNKNPYKFNVYEEFESQAAFDYHQSRVQSFKWGKVTKNAIRNYQIGSA